MNIILYFIICLILALMAFSRHIKIGKSNDVEEIEELTGERDFAIIAFLVVTVIPTIIYLLLGILNLISN